jgi:hypothetical protein
MVTKTEAVKAFLIARTHPELARMYSHDMECQVIVRQGQGEKIDGEFEGVRWIGYTDGLNTWKPFRIPRNASTEPVYQDTPMTFDIDTHAEGVGMTGWDWKARRSRWVAFDFDAISGHSEKHANKLSAEMLDTVKNVACEIPWVTVRKSTSGKGLHLYVFVDVATENHTEHAALARSILGKLSSLTGFDFTSKVDICGGNMWVWHRKMVGTDGLTLIKQGDQLNDIPPNWKDHLKVIKGSSKKLTVPTDITEIQTEDKFEVLAGQRTRVKLDKEHLALVQYLNDNGHYHWWDQDHHMLITHTQFLKKAHTDLKLRGIFETETKATSSHNCFLFPMRRGAWSVRRYSPGCKEHSSWDQDGAGWTRTYLNQEPTLSSAAQSFGGIEDPTGGYCFDTVAEATKTGLALGAGIDIHPKFHGRAATIKLHKDKNRLVVEFTHEKQDAPSDLQGWLLKRGKWVRMFHMQYTTQTDTDTDSYDDTVRHLITEAGVDAGWCINCDGKWVDEPLTHIRSAMNALGTKRNDVETVIGNSVLKPWTIVNVPFKSEYIGDRIWNRHSTQFKFTPSIGDSLSYPTWLAVLSHVGKSLNDYIKDDPWCKRNGITTGADYLKIWVASMIQFPYQPLPYLFVYGEKQVTGKSTFHEALSLLFEPGVMNIGTALKNKATFNAELEGVILGFIEELDLNSDKQAYERVKDWVTSPKISVHRKGDTPYMAMNTLHVVHTANARRNCPIFPGDTRIVMIHVPDRPETEIPKPALMKLLEKEAPDFLAAVINLELPESDSRLRIPVIQTADKAAASDMQKSSLLLFIEECCFRTPGQTVTMADFYERFIAWLNPEERPYWATKQKVSAGMPEDIIKGRTSQSADWRWANITFDPTAPVKQPLILLGKDKLVPSSMSPVSPVQEKTTLSSTV